MENLRIVGAAIAFLGILIFAFGKKWIVFRWFIGDRGMFFQMIIGFVVFAVGLILLFLSGSLTQ